MNQAAGKCATIFVLVIISITPACSQKMQVTIPHASWEPVFFQLINLTAKLSGQSDLRTTQLPKGDIEVRIWWGFGLTPLEGVTLKCAGNQWSGILVKAANYHDPTKVERVQLSAQKSGWETMWKQLVSSDLLTLPDASEIDCNVHGLDGISWVVEINTDNTYRTYMYDMPSLSKCKEDKSILAINDIIADEFNLGGL